MALVHEDEAILGRSNESIEKYGSQGTAFFGKVVMSSGQNPVLGRKVLIDLAEPHLILICGKRGYGKSYSMAVLMEEMARLPFSIRQRLSVIVIDTVGIFWSLKIPDKKNVSEIGGWGLKPASTGVRVFVPKGRLSFYQEHRIPVDGAFTLKASELEGMEWMTLFRLSWKDSEGVLLGKMVDELKDSGKQFGIDELIEAVRSEKKAPEKVKEAVIGRLLLAKQWGLIEKEGTSIPDLVKPGTINVIDVSAYRQAIGMEGTRDLVVAILGKKLFEQRMLYRKSEESKLIAGEKRESKMPLIWMFVDEAHMFMPKDEQSLSLQVLLEWVRVGRQPGLGLVLATQRPNKLHPDAISQCDLFIAHRMTSQMDIQAVSALRPSYMYSDFDKYFHEMPRGRGFALILDDNTEKLWLVKVRPRLSWDASVTASAMPY